MSSSFGQGVASVALLGQQYGACAVDGERCGQAWDALAVQLLEERGIAAGVIWHAAWSVEVQGHAEETERITVSHSLEVIRVPLLVGWGELLAARNAVLCQRQVCLKLVEKTILLGLNAGLPAEAVRCICAEVLHLRRLASLAAWLL
eukprot:CAMPEP_0197659656 /NCGR_PEP_ID=MMETSP1338-20131121/48567_1 /TAXON_ID=43686 ORGANISM="Pelagodinium beii, Strain RCC1491" /NCGR_SAMPLE_ID=MMETSP1338 /ASSEMBLY_ACC=CAM_ASM_000754 /LENGTH=146 /DNA_ID=CAMNT_0043236689 /DNA_START=169 /DNA_END=608 /DNA_ORIENTATION=-